MLGTVANKARVGITKHGATIYKYMCAACYEERLAAYTQGLPLYRIKERAKKLGAVYVCELHAMLARMCPARRSVIDLIEKAARDEREAKRNEQESGVPPKA